MPLTCTVTAIAWERVHLSVTIAFSAAPAGAVSFVIEDEGRVFPVRSVAIDAMTYRLDMNITNFRDRSQIPDGTWRFLAQVDGTAAVAAGYDLTALEQLERDSRTYLYSSSRTAYVVQFGITESDTRPEFLMRTYQMTRTGGTTPRPATVKEALQSFVTRRVLPRRRRIKLANACYALARRISPPPGNRILFASEMRASMEGNLARIHDRMVERGLDGQFQMRYSFRLPRTGSKASTLRLIFLIATSDVMLIDDYFGMLESLNVSPQTKIIQVWHAGSGFKTIGYSRFGRYGSPRLHNAHRKYTYAITGSKHLVPVYAEAFGIEESAVIPTGLPRIDTFLDAERTEQVVAEFFSSYPHLRGKRIILFAPTFRGRGIADAYYDYAKIDFEKLYEACGERSVVLFRMHHFIRKPVPIPPRFADRLFDLASYPETNDLLHVTDVLITDYSSIIYEFALLDRPMLFYAYDKEVYSATRGFHRDYELTAPGKVCESFDELVKAIQDEDYDTWKVDAFRRENFDVIDTNSADRVIDQLILGDPHTSDVATSVPATADAAETDVDATPPDAPISEPEEA